MFNVIKKTIARCIPTSVVVSKINTSIQDYAKILNLNINKKHSAIEVQFLLKGEATPIDLKINHFVYRNNHLKIADLSCSKDWIQALLREFALNKNHKIPASVSPYLEGFLT